jgi:hypothetical protein
MNTTYTIPASDCSDPRLAQNKGEPGAPGTPGFGEIRVGDPAIEKGVGRGSRVSGCLAVHSDSISNQAFPFLSILIEVSVWKQLFDIVFTA